jgi:AsmA-like C-terminal region
MSLATAAETPVIQKRRVSRRWLLLAPVIVLVLVGIGITVLAASWPFTRQSVIDALQESSARTVTIDRFYQTYFPPGCVAEGISFLHRKHKDKPGLITVQKLTIQGSYSGLIGSPKRLTKVRVLGMHVTVPPRSPNGSSPIMPLTDVKSRRPIVIGTVFADGAVLDFMSAHPGKEAFKLVIDKLALDGVGNNKPMSYRAMLPNTEPPGEIHSTGRFGPWDADDPGRTPITGSYTFEHADLGVFKDISGILSSGGEFSGTLDHLDINGHGDVPNLHVAHSGHTTHVTSEFHAAVNATDGDTFLEDVHSHLNRTMLVSKGSVAGTPGEKGKTVSLDVSTTNGRIEDLLDLFIAAKRPLMTGAVSLRAKVILAPDRKVFLEKLKVDGDFGLVSGKFTSTDTQGTLNKLSMSAHPEETPEEKEDPETALSNLKGHVSARHGIATLTNIFFSIPGADAQIHGTYNLLTQEVDLHGVLRTSGKVYVTTQGFKSFLLRAMTPFLKHEAHATIVPFKVTGAYPNTTIALELFAKR